jgi:trehalose 6-phosphate synthase/phosphatase
MQGEIVKRILYKNPDTEFIFCAGDDKVFTRSKGFRFLLINLVVFQTDEDMFRALLLFPVGVTKAVMEPPVSVLHNGIIGGVPQPVELAIAPEAIFTTAVGHSSKRTLASWHVTTTTEVVDHMLQIANHGGEASVKSGL